MNVMYAMEGNTKVNREVIGYTSMLDYMSVEISIADTGPGIPPSVVDRIFDPFFTTKENGMGIGLSIARTIVKAHGGRIWAENRTGGGAVFRVTVPRAAPEAARAAE